MHYLEDLSKLVLNSVSNTKLGALRSLNTSNLERKEELGAFELG